MKTWQRAVGGHVIAYDDFGSGPPLVLIHAFPQCREMWFPQRAALTASYRLICPDVCGFGGSSLPADGWSIDSQADLFAEFLDSLGLREPFVLGGLSMGGYIAFAFARRHPDKLRALILANTRADADNPEAKSNRDAAIQAVRANGAGYQIRSMVPKALGITTHEHRPEVIAEVVKMGSEQSVDGIAAALAALRDRPNALPGLSAISVPTLVIVGVEDAITPPAVAESLASAIPKAKLAVLPAAGHLSNLEVPAEFNRAILDFLGTLP